jgi:hypothetical protein
MAIDTIKTGFTGDFIRVNGLDRDSFMEWVFYRGMAFMSSDKWPL